MQKNKGIRQIYVVNFSYHPRKQYMTVQFMLVACNRHRDREHIKRICTRFMCLWSGRAYRVLPVYYANSNDIARSRNCVMYPRLQILPSVVSRFHGRTYPVWKNNDTEFLEKVGGSLMKFACMFAVLIIWMSHDFPFYIRE